MSRRQYELSHRDTRMPPNELTDYQLLRMVRIFVEAALVVIVLSFAWPDVWHESNNMSGNLETWASFLGTLPPTKKKEKQGENKVAFLWVLLENHAKRGALKERYTQMKESQKGKGVS